MKVTVLLRNDHENLKALFDRFSKPSSSRMSNGKKEVFDAIQREIMIHSQMEREILYPTLSATSSDRGPEIVARAEQHHESIERLLEELEGMNIADPEAESKMSSLREEFLRHVEFDEDTIFDEARKTFPEYRLEELGLEMEDRRRILSTLAA
jgi:iron-sulfur cluster repair protein YtfE (RIC family)